MGLINTGAKPLNAGEIIALVSLIVVVVFGLEQALRAYFQAGELNAIRQAVLECQQLSGFIANLAQQTFEALSNPIAIPHPGPIEPSNQPNTSIVTAATGIQDGNLSNNPSEVNAVPPTSNIQAISPDHMV